ncbi:MAG TPA: RNB domain-containing ribonuclease [Sedimenticola thiotaurini]|uniref:RNB domain-containing ribonuclease n=1 Tax=Sedimenticola thiotaurini TaxID=1543721 RepID=A0A831RMY6_9GAMM|nr:RNB domain-containing ribonuclease [Sedimenticola thiotaurini]
MASHMISPGSLVLYKIRPALVTGISDKIDIDLDGGRGKRVRTRDITLLHPGPLTSLAELRPLEADVTEAWELVAGEATDLEELAELIFGEYTPVTAWSAWQRVVDGLYFEGTPDRILARSPQQVEEELARREAKAAEEQAWAGFLHRLEQKRIDGQDRERLREVERRALEQAAHSRILQALERPDTPQEAHRLLLEAGYWEPAFNPHPQRLGLSLDNPELPPATLPEEPRRDLTGLQTFAIDDQGSEDPDDAISLDGDRVWVHVADVAALATPDSALDLEARERAANLYLPDRIVHMLPPHLTRQLGLGLQRRSPALSFGLRLGGEGEVTELEVVPSWVQVTRLTYEEADRQLDRPPFDHLRRLADRNRRRRMSAGAAGIELPEVSVRVDGEGRVRIRPIERRDSRELVTELMLMAGEAVARHALERQIPMPFVSQPAPEQPARPQGLAAMYAYRRQLRPSRADTLEAPHAGLGLAAYVRSTSPLRRYLDLVAHQQLRAVVTGGTPLSVAEVSARITASNQASATVRRAERLSNLHWKLIHLRQNPHWRGSATVVELRDQKATLLIPDLAMETRLRLPGAVLEQKVTLALRDLDLAEPAAWFRVQK